MAFISEMLTMVDSTTASYTHAAYDRVVGAHSTEIHLVLVVYVALLGWLVMNQKIEMTLQAATRHLLMMVVVVSLATRWDIFSVFMYDTLTTGPNKLIVAVSSGSVDPQGQLGVVYDKGFQAAGNLFQAGGWSAILPTILGAAVGLCTLLVVAYALFLIILSKFALAVLLAVAPIFLLFLLFPATRNFFTSYLGQAINYALIPVMVYGILTLSLAIIDLALNQFTAASPNSGAFTVSSYVVLSEAIVFVILKQVMSMAAALGGGLQLSTMSAMGNAFQKLSNSGFAKQTKQKIAQAAQRGGKAARDYAGRAMKSGRSLVGRR